MKPGSGRTGTRKNNGEWQRHAIAFQGNVRDENNKAKTEIFIADIPEDMTKPSADGPLQGTGHYHASASGGRDTKKDHALKGWRSWPKALVAQHF